ncbi:MAG: dicarboxylate/amino acid:cation symporter [Pseudomonadota bacterium]
MQLWHKVLIGLIGGILCGFILGEHAAYLKPIGDIFIRLIKMIVIPLIFFSIINGLRNIKDANQLGRIGIKAASAFVLCTCFAISLGMLAAWLFQPGVGLVLKANAHQTADVFEPVAMLLNIIPDNIVAAMARGDLMQVVFFSIFCGVTLVLMGPSANHIFGMVKDLTAVVLSMIRMIVRFSPVAAFCLMAWCVGTQGSAVLYSLSKLVMAGVFAFTIQYFVFGGLIAVWGGLSPLPFYRKSFEYQAMAFSTSSTKAALPVTMSVCRDKMGISKLSSSFILPLGATINMDGLAIYLGLCAICFAQAAGHTLTYGEYATIMFTSTLGSIGGAGIPSAAIVMLPMILGSVNLPLEGVLLITGIDRLMDTFRTTISITGDAAVTLVVDSSEGMLDREKYYS